MKQKSIITLILVSGLVLVARGVGAVEFEDVEKLMDSARTVEAPIFSPKAFAKAQDQFDQARQVIRLKRSSSELDKYLIKTREFAENALKNTDVCKLALREYLPPRDKARTAKAYLLVPALYDKAEEVFTSAAEKVESGDVKGGLKEAGKAEPLFDVAEIEAIRVEIMGKADKLIETAVFDEAQKYALTCLDKARTAREKANDILTADRYNREAAAIEAARAEYEASHASNIAQSVRSLNRNDQAWEKLMLVYEIQMDRVGNALQMEYLPFDKGPSEAADSLIAAIRQGQGTLSADAGSARDSIAVMRRELDELRRTQSELTKQLRATAGVFGDSMLTDPVELARSINADVAAIVKERGQLAEAHEEVSAELEARQAHEQRLAEAKAMIDPTQGEILVSGANDIILRLYGLSFAAGKSEITQEHLPLLEKVKQIITLFPESPLVVEGHTDDRGDPASNTQLSEKRAFAITQYLRQALSIPSDRIRAIGYGSEKPIASQATAEGRAKNRRIDILILQ
jgi:OOP family OmpA-OmpF porin